MWALKAGHASSCGNCTQSYKLCSRKSSFSLVFLPGQRGKALAHASVLPKHRPYAVVVGFGVLTVSQA